MSQSFQIHVQQILFSDAVTRVVTSHSISWSNQVICCHFPDLTHCLESLYYLYWELTSSLNFTDSSHDLLQQWLPKKATTVRHLLGETAFTTQSFVVPCHIYYTITVINLIYILTPPSHSIPLCMACNVPFTYTNHHP